MNTPSDIHTNLVKLCVGTFTVEQLETWQETRFGSRGINPEHVTRSHPRRADEILRGGSLYWVVRGRIMVRQRIIALERRDCDDGVTRCAIVFDPQIIRTFPVPRQPFQGWRYLEPNDSPADLPASRQNDDDIPPAIHDALLEIGVI